MSSQSSHADLLDAVSPPRYLPALLLLFIGSGCAALIYEIVWLQLLQLVIGSTAYSLGVLLGTFMGGMCLGSLVLPRLLPARLHPLRVYAVLELLIGAIGLSVLYVLPMLTEKYTAMASGPEGMWWRMMIAGACLLPPTILMGATLPAIARWVETTPAGVSWMGFFYGGNIIGAVVGCLAAGFFLLPQFDMPIATYVAVAINGIVAILGLVLSNSTDYRPALPQSGMDLPLRAPGARWVYLVIALSGLTGLGSEVVWTRLLGLMLGANVYTFSIILAVFLFGLGIGSTAGSVIARDSLNPRRALGICQFLLAGAVAWACFAIARSLPFWPIELTYARSPFFTFQLHLMCCAYAILPGAILWGASFPIALAAVSARGQDPGRLVGGVYAANTVGAIVGSLAFALVIVPAMTTVGAQRLLVGLCALSAIIAFLPDLRSEPELANEEEPSEPNWGWMMAIVLIVLIGVSLIISIVAVPWQVVAWGRQTAYNLKSTIDGIKTHDEGIASQASADRFCTYVGEGMNVSVAVTESRSTGYQYFHGAGKVQASSDPQDMRLQRMLGHLSVLAHPNPDDVRDVLVVACGAGVTAGSFIPYPKIQSVTIVDIEKLVPTQVTPKFSAQNYGIVDHIKERNPDTVQNKQVQVIFDDGRHHVRTMKEKYDIITSDPIDPWVKGCAALNTVEYYQMCKDHLKPGGVMSLWIPLYESDTATAKSVIGTFFKVFPNGILFSNDNRGVGYDAVLFGVNADGPLNLNVDEIQKLLDSPEYAPVKTSLQEVGFGSSRGGGFGGAGMHAAVDLLGTYAGQATNLDQPVGSDKPWRADAEINTDRNLRLQYLAGMSLNLYEEEAILNGILKSYRFPTEVFHGSEPMIQELKQVLRETRRYESGTPSIRLNNQTQLPSTQPSPAATQ